MTRRSCTRCARTIERGSESTACSTTRDRTAGRQISCPVLVAWGADDDIEELWGDPTIIWRNWANDVRGARIDSGHHLAEEAPEELALVLRDFLNDYAAGTSIRTASRALPAQGLPTSSDGGR